MDPIVLIGTLLIGGLISALALAMIRVSPPPTPCLGCRVRNSTRFQHSSAGHTTRLRQPSRMNLLGRLIDFVLRFNAGRGLIRLRGARHESARSSRVVRYHSVVLSHTRRV
jgi:hypothetical protein